MRASKTTTLEQKSKKQQEEVTTTMNISFKVCLLALVAALVVSSVHCKSRSLQQQWSSVSRGSSRAGSGPNGQFSFTSSFVSGNGRSRASASTQDTQSDSAAVSEGDGEAVTAGFSGQDEEGNQVSATGASIDGEAAAGSIAETEDTTSASGAIGLDEDAEAAAANVNVQDSDGDGDSRFFARARGRSGAAVFGRRDGFANFFARIG